MFEGDMMYSIVRFSYIQLVIVTHQRTMIAITYPPPPEGIAPSPPNEDECKLFFVPDCHQFDSAGHAQYISKEVKVRST